MVEGFFSEHSSRNAFLHGTALVEFLTLSSGNSRKIEADFLRRYYMEPFSPGHRFISANRSRLVLLSLVLATAPAQAQWFGWPAGSPAPATPATPLPPVPAADLALWLKNAGQAADAARAAQKKGNQAQRNAAIIDTLKSIEKVVDPHNVPDASRLAALEIVGLLARDMNTWKMTFDEVKAGTLLVMNEVRAKSILDKVPNIQKAPIQMHLGEIGAAQDYSHVAFEYFCALARNPEADIALVKHGARRAISFIPGNNPRSASPIFERMLNLPLTAEEQKWWQNQRAMHIVNVEYQGEEREAALALIKAQVFDAATPADTREELARAYEKAVFDEEEATQLYTAMLGRPKLSPPNKSHWLHLRGNRNVNSEKYAEAAADYELAAHAAPANSTQRDEALWDNAWVRLTHLNSKGDVPAAVAPTLVKLIDSPHFTKDKRYNISTQLLFHYFAIKDYASAQKLVALRKELSGDNLPRRVESDVEMVRVHIGQNQLEAAVALWTAQPYEELMNGKRDWGSAKYQATSSLMRVGSALYSALVKAKNFELAQKVVDDPESARIFQPGDYQLLRADLAVSKGDYPGALTVLRALLESAKTPQDKATVNAYIANVEKLQTTAPVTTPGG
jgi:hypothetical protein